MSASSAARSVHKTVVTLGYALCLLTVFVAIVLSTDKSLSPKPIWVTDHSAKIVLAQYLGGNTTAE